MNSITYSYLVGNKESKEAAVIEPIHPTAIMIRLKHHQFKLKYIINTSYLVKRTQGNREISMRTRAKVVAHQLDSTKIPEVRHPAFGGETLDFGQIPIVILHTPGVTLGSVCIKIGPYLFSGDTLYIGGCGKSQSPDLLDEMYFSLISTIYNLPEETIIYPSAEKSLDCFNFATSIEPQNRHIQAKKVEVQRCMEDETENIRSTLQEENLVNPFVRLKDIGFIENFAKLYGVMGNEKTFFYKLIDLRNKFFMRKEEERRDN